MNSPHQCQKPANGKVRALLIVGAPGSGKGTQGRALGALPHFVHCSCGEVFRSVNIDTKLGREFLKHSRTGRLMPDAVTTELWLAHVATLTSRGLFNPISDYLVLDGIPRNPQQARLMESNIAVEWVFNLCCPSRQALIARLRNRALKENRLDDADESVINYRLDIYESESQQMLSQYPAEIIYVVDATHPPPLVLKKILDVIVMGKAYGERRDPPTQIQCQVLK